MLKPKPGLAIESVDGEAIVLDQDAGQVHQLNESAALVWDGLGEGKTVAEIAALLCEAFDIEHDKAVSDVKAAVSQFEELGLLVD